jgi:RNA binding exosome subunit
MINNIVFSVFSESAEEIKVESKLKELIGFDILKEKIKIEKKTVKGLNESEQVTFNVLISRKGLAKKVANKLISRLSGEDKKVIIKTLDSRFSDDQHLFLRFDKNLFLENNLKLCDHGCCFHVKISIVTFPRNLEKGKEEILEILN